MSKYTITVHMYCRDVRLYFYRNAPSASLVDVTPCYLHDRTKGYFVVLSDYMEARIWGIYNDRVLEERYINSYKQT